MDKSYDTISDEVLIDRIRDGEDSITEYIMNKYKNLVRKKANTMYILGADSEDLIQEGMIGLFKAIKDYDAGRDASFYTFADLCISRQIYKAVQASRRQKHYPLNSYISLYSSNNTLEGGEEEELLDLLSGKEEQNPEELFIGKEALEDLEKKIEQELSGFENEVLDLYIIGLSYVQIAKILGRDEKATDNALQRIKSKIKKIIK